MNRIPTRTPDECRRLAARALAGEPLGLTDAFLAHWGPPPSAPKKATPKAAQPAPKKAAAKPPKRRARAKSAA